MSDKETQVLKSRGKKKKAGKQKQEVKYRKDKERLDYQSKREKNTETAVSVSVADSQQSDTHGGTREMVEGPHINVVLFKYQSLSSLLNTLDLLLVFGCFQQPSYTYTCMHVR